MEKKSCEINYKWYKNRKYELNNEWKTNKFKYEKIKVMKKQFYEFHEIIQKKEYLIKWSNNVVIIMENNTFLKIYNYVNSRIVYNLY